eukprot:4178296-Amphidinium_carterae.1
MEMLGLMEVVKLKCSNDNGWSYVSLMLLGDVLLFEFDMETEAAATDPVDIFDVIGSVMMRSLVMHSTFRLLLTHVSVGDGSWGSATHVATWTNDNHVLAVTLG